MYLAVITKTIIDQAFVAAIPEVPEVVEDLTVDPPIIGAPAVPAVPEVPLITHDEVERTYVEDADAVVAMNIANGVDITYYYMKFNASLRPTLKTVREKSRTAAPAREVITIESQDGEELGSGVV